MSNKVEVQTRNIRLTEKIEEYVNKKAGNFDHYLPAIEEARVELAHHKAARNATDRNVAQITVYGKGFTLRTEERADEALAAFDQALDNMQRQIERYKGKHQHGRGDGRSAAEAAEPEADQPDRRVEADPQPAKPGEHADQDVRRQGEGRVRWRLPRRPEAPGQDVRHPP